MSYVDTVGVPVGVYFEMKLTAALAAKAAIWNWTALVSNVPTSDILSFEAMDKIESI